MPINLEHLQPTRVSKAFNYHTLPTVEHRGEPPRKSRYLKGYAGVLCNPEYPLYIAEVAAEKD